MPDPLEDLHYTTVAAAIADGDVVLFLGAGVNLCGRPKGACYQLGKYLPSGGELAEYLANRFAYSEGDKKDLLRVSQYAALTRGTGPLYQKLYDVFAAKYPTTPLHQFLAALPALLREKGYPPYQLIVTTNYDDVLECAFEAAGEPFDLVCYVAEGKQSGKFWHQPPEGEARLIEKPNEYHDLSLDQRSVILKIHGAVDRAGVVEQSSFVITEDHYIDYLTRTKISGLVPVGLAAKMRTSGYLFLGYGLRDWNLRVILHRIWGEQPLSYQSWAIQLDPKQLDRKFWMKRDVEIVNQRLEDYIAALDKRMQALPGAGGEI
jgi:hypothetical protein